MRLFKRLPPRLKDVLYVLSLIGVLLFAANCECVDATTQHTYVVCQKNPNGTYSASSITVPGAAPPNSTDVRVSGSTSFAGATGGSWSCPDTTGSPVWNKSEATVPVTQPVTPVQPPGDMLRRPRATSPGTVGYLPQALLNLPFPALGSANPQPLAACSSSQPNVIQVNHYSATVNRISTCPLAAVATIPVAANPLQIEITPDGATALVTSYNNAVNFINLATNQVTFTLSTPGIFPNGIAITPDGQNFYITNFLPTGASLLEYNLTTHQQIFSMPAPTYPQNLFLSPDGAQLFVTFPYANQVWVLDTLTNTLVYTLSIQAPRGIAFNSKGTKAYIASTDNPDLSVNPGTVKEFDTGTFQVTNTYNVGVGPNDIAVLYFDQFVMTTNYEGQSISRINLMTGTVQTVAVGGQLSGLAIVQ
jgi:DNA-binding beta-propeller fold protein YncE